MSDRTVRDERMLLPCRKERIVNLFVHLLFDVVVFHRVSTFSVSAWFHLLFSFGIHFQAVVALVFGTRLTPTLPDTFLLLAPPTVRCNVFHSR